MKLDVTQLNNFTFMLPCIVIDFFLNNQPDTLIIQVYSVTKLYMFRASSLPIIRSSVLYIRHWFHSGFWWPFPSRVSQSQEWLWLTAWKQSSKSCMKLTSAEYTVEISWWWAEKMPETCRAAFLKLCSADHKWSSGSALVVLLDWTLVQKKTEKIKLTWIAYQIL